MCRGVCVRPRDPSFRRRARAPFSAGRGSTTVSAMDAKLATCLLYTKVLTADGMMTENERAFLEQAMKHHGLSAEDRQKVLDLEGWDHAESALKSLDRESKERIVADLLDAASADGRLSPLEVATVKAIARDLGVET